MDVYMDGDTPEAPTPTATGNFDPQFWYSIFIILMTWTCSEILLFTIFYVWPDPKLRIRVYLAEVIMTFERVATAYELGVMLGGYGLAWYAVLFFVTVMWYSLHWGPNKSSISYHWSNFEARRSGLFEIFIHMTIEILAGLIVWPCFTKPLWSFCEHHPLRGAKLHGTWGSAIRTPLYIACLSEFGFSLIVEFAVKVFFAWFHGNMINKIITALFIDVTVLLGMGQAGGFCDPSLATITQISTVGSTIWEQFLVFWISSIVGTILGGIAFLKIRKYVTPEEKKD